MKCPVCHIDMVVVEYKRIELDHCLRCTGVWFDSGELELLLKSRGLPQASPHTAPDVKVKEEKRRCPLCRRKMDKVRIGEEGVLIDACPREEGLWFDGGEVDELIAGVSEGAGGIASFLGEVFQARQGKEPGGA